MTLAVGGTLNTKTQQFVLHFGENFMKIGTKIAKLQMHENLHKNVNENMKNGARG